ncbi:Hypothetical predicted protein [Lecanosticta acicola]|uniref:Uncharacterized protein n=1 Tax=Lecanosticta acicola TaxID=111012 RepID=A0AAI8YTA9_9PEZI|nr:Hypothetical predicted protein [Lecanosticta acicola]
MRVEYSQNEVADELKSKWCLVYVKSDDTASLEPLEFVEKHPSQPLYVDRVSRSLLQWEQKIKVPVSAKPRSHASKTTQEDFRISKEGAWGSNGMVQDCDGSYVSILVFNRIAKNMTWKRVAGRVKSYMVFEEPLV